MINHEIVDPNLGNSSKVMTVEAMRWRIMSSLICLRVLLYQLLLFCRRRQHDFQRDFQSSLDIITDLTMKSSNNTFILVSAIIVSVLLQRAKGFYLTIDAHAEECFFERVATGTKMGLTFEVIDGGFYDIDVKINGPDDKVIHQEDRASSGKYTFAAHMDGVYTYCFGNKMSTMTPKAVMFSIDVGDAPKAADTAHPAASGDGKTDENHNKLEEQIKELSAALTAVKHEQEYMSVRDRMHRQINESTNSRVVLWAFFEAIILVAMTLGQVFYLKRFFEVRRVV